MDPKYFFTICWQHSSGSNSHRSLCSFFVPPTSSISQKHLTQLQLTHREAGQMFRRLRLQICPWEQGLSSASGHRRSQCHMVCSAAPVLDRRGRLSEHCHTSEMKGSVCELGMLCKSHRNLLLALLGFGHSWTFPASYTRFAGQLEHKGL